MLVEVVKSVLKPVSAVYHSTLNIKRKLKGERKMASKRYSESLEDYLEAICLKGGANVKSVELARHLNVSRASVNKAVNTLIEKKLVEKEYYGDISLTEEGQRISNEILRKHKLLKKFLIDILDVPEDIASIEACGIEHSISDETAHKLELLMESLKKE
jgi:Mn-dependent DtxR family transcriptional regulator